MGIGVSIFVIALGAIIAFGVEASLGWLNLNVVGWVLMLAGLTSLILTMHFWNRRRRAADLLQEHHYYGHAGPRPPSQADTVPVVEDRHPAVEKRPVVEKRTTEERETL